MPGCASPPPPPGSSGAAQASAAARTPWPPGVTRGPRHTAERCPPGHRPARLRRAPRRRERRYCRRHRPGRPSACTAQQRAIRVWCGRRHHDGEGVLYGALDQGPLRRPAGPPRVSSPPGRAVVTVNALQRLHLGHQACSRVCQPMQRGGEVRAVQRPRTLTPLPARAMGTPSEHDTMTACVASPSPGPPPPQIGDLLARDTASSPTPVPCRRGRPPNLTLTAPRPWSSPPSPRA